MGLTKDELKDDEIELASQHILQAGFDWLVMEFSKEILEKKLAELQRTVQLHPEDAVLQMQLSELMSRYKKLTGNEPPATTRAAPPGVRIGQFNVKGDGNAIAPGGIAIGKVEINFAALKEQSIADSLVRTGGNVEAVAKALNVDQSAVREINIKRSGDDLVTYPSPICRIECYDKEKSLASFGTGFRISPRLVLTCRHLFPLSLRDLSKVTLFFNGERSHGLKNRLESVTFSHHLRAEAYQHDGKVHLWHESPVFETEEEFKSGNRDLALIEIAPESKVWGISLEAESSVLQSVTTFDVLAQAQDRSMGFPLKPQLHASLNEKSEQSYKMVRIHPSGGHREDFGTTNSESVLAWHRTKRTEEGDSGSPLVEDLGWGLIGMHHSRGSVAGEDEKRGRFVHIHEILKSLKGDQNLVDSSHAQELKAAGWL
ncbi:MAG: trypsin-like peptidase domain-containing protein [Verrucomicrobiales bacterium]